MNESLIKNCL